MARPTLFTDDLALKLVEALERLPIKYACGKVGIHPDTYTNWMARGDAGEQPFADFSILARASRANYVAERVEVIHDAGKADWRAAAWYLERACPDDFGAKSEVKQKIDLRNLTDAEVIAQATGGDGRADPSGSDDPAIGD